MGEGNDGGYGEGPDVGAEGRDGESYGTEAAETEATSESRDATTEEVDAAFDDSETETVDALETIEVAETETETETETELVITEDVDTETEDTTETEIETEETLETETETEETLETETETEVTVETEPITEEEIAAAFDDPSEKKDTETKTDQPDDKTTQALEKAPDDRTWRDTERVDQVRNQDFEAQKSFKTDPETGKVLVDKDGKLVECAPNVKDSVRPDLIKQGKDGLEIRENKNYSNVNNLMQNIKHQSEQRKANFGENVQQTYVVAPKMTVEEAMKLQDYVENKLGVNLEIQHK